MNLMLANANLAHKLVRLNSKSLTLLMEVAWCACKAHSIAG